MSRLVLLDIRDLLPAAWSSLFSDGPVRAFNPGLLRDGEGWILAYRIVGADMIRRIGVCRLDHELRVVAGSALPFSDGVRFREDGAYLERTRTWFADPRLHRFQGRIFLYWNSGWHEPRNYQFLQEVDAGTLLPVGPARELRFKGSRPLEKNWGFFEHGDECRAVYSVSPHRILNVSLAGEGPVECVDLCTSSWDSGAYARVHGEPRGGAPPQRLGEHYYSFIHSVSGRKGDYRYEAAVYRFAADRPFAPTDAPAAPLVLPRPGEGRAYAPLNAAINEIIYPCGVAQEGGGRWVLSYGIDDERCALSVLEQSEVDAALTPARRTEQIADARAILVLRLDGVGDLVLTSPFLRELRRGAPRAWISLVVSPASYELAMLCPYVDEVLVFDGLAVGRLAKLRVYGRALAFAASRLWRRGFDLALLPRRDVDYYHASFLAYVSGASVRVGHAQDGVSKVRVTAGLDRFLTLSTRSGAAVHEVERNLEILSLAGGAVEQTSLELWLSEDDRRTTAAVLASQGAAQGCALIAFGLGASAARRRWPVERFADLGRRLLGKADVRILILGGAEDVERGARLRSDLGERAVDLTGRLSWRQSAAALERCRLMISNDTGAMHVAAAAGIPVVEISCHPAGADPEDDQAPERFGPWGAPSAVLRPRIFSEPCRRSCLATSAHCILDVSVADVEKAAAGLMSLR